MHFTGRMRYFMQLSHWPSLGTSSLVKSQPPFLLDRVSTIRVSSSPTCASWSVRWVSFPRKLPSNSS